MGAAPQEPIAGGTALTMRMPTAVNEVGGARAIVGAMAKTGVRRVVAVSASGLFREAGEPR